MQFLTLYVVGVLNLALGFWAMRRWRECRPPQEALKHTSPAKPLTPEEALRRLIGELKAQAAFLAQQLVALKQPAVTAREIQEIAAELEVAVECLMKTINTASDVFAASNSEAHLPLVDELEIFWNGISDAALQMVTLSFDSDDAERTRSTLQDACREVAAICEDAEHALTVHMDSTAACENAACEHAE